MPSLDSFKCRKKLTVGTRTYHYYSLKTAEKNGLKGVSNLPFSMFAATLPQCMQLTVPNRHICLVMEPRLPGPLIRRAGSQISFPLTPCYNAG